jgi:hypothetical protein
MTHRTDSARQRIAVIGTGIAGLGAAWLLDRRHDVTLFEQNDYVGGHSHTVDVTVDGRRVAVDTGFIVYNALNYPNLVALFAELGVATQASDMSFAVSLDGGRLEYAGTNLAGLFAQRRNLLRPRFWQMLKDLTRFYREAPGYLAAGLACESIGALLDRRGYSAAFREDHLLPMAGAIWSATPREIAAYPAKAFIEFFRNHGLLQLADRPEWRTVCGGSRNYVARILEQLRGRVVTNAGITRVVRHADRVSLYDARGQLREFDHVVIAAHADQALGLLAEPSADERNLLGAFRYTPNRAVLHGDRRLMPHRRASWASWNYLADGDAGARRLCVTYWMNRLQQLPTAEPVLVTLNPLVEPERIHAEFSYDHPYFDQRAIASQPALWRLQGARRTWFCGSYFGFGFHEDALQSGLRVAELLGGLARPWDVDPQADRVHAPLNLPAAALPSAA